MHAGTYIIIGFTDVIKEIGCEKSKSWVFAKILNHVPLETKTKTIDKEKYFR